MRVDLPHHIVDRPSLGVLLDSFSGSNFLQLGSNWLQPHWNPAFCAGQGGFVGHEVKVANVKPEYRWFDGTSYVYNIGETIQPNPDGTYTMAKANGAIFDGKSKIVPIKDHWTIMPLHESGQMVPPAIYWMFMTGDFDQAVQKGMEDFGMTGSYTIVDANAEMLITHGVDPKSEAPTCSECHTMNGETPDGYGIVPFGELGYHTWPAKVKSCNLCHPPETMPWKDFHDYHAKNMGKDCKGCHTTEPTGWLEPVVPDGLCNNCHSASKADAFFDGTMNAQRLHLEHAENQHGPYSTLTKCVDCHTF